MSGAIRLQLRRPGMGLRVLASLTSIWLVVCGVLCANHESRVGHYVDATTGDIRHGSHIDGHRLSTQSHLHDSKAAGDNDACELAAHLRTPVEHHTPSLAIAATVAIAPQPVFDVGPGPDTGLIYLLAPKTSPPSA